MIDLNKYKTYDTSTGHGSPDEWRSSFKNRREWFRFAHEVINEETVAINKPLAKCKTIPELNKEFRRLLLIHHPDIAGDTKENTQKTQELIAIYERLKKKLK